MLWLTDLAVVLRTAGLPVIEVDGWKTRGWGGKPYNTGGPMLGIKGGLVHHTGTSARAGGDYPSLGIVRDGRSDVAGPLAQLGLGRSGTWYVIAAGLSNHPGAVDNQNYASAWCLGVEAEHPGGDTPWPVNQYASYVKGCRVLGKHYGITWRGHKEAATPKGRKVDPNFNMDLFRHHIANGFQEEIEDDMPTAREVADEILLKSFVERVDTNGKTYKVSVLQEIADAGTFARQARDLAQAALDKVSQAPQVNLPEGSEVTLKVKADG